MRKKRILMLIGSVCLAMMLLVPLAVSCGPATPEEAVEEIAALEAEIDELEGNVSAKDAEISDLEAEIAALKKPAEAITFRLQTYCGAETDFWCQDFVERVNKVSGGRLKIDYYYGGSIVPNDQLLTAVGSGQLDAAMGSADYWPSDIDVALLECPFFGWSNIAEAYRVWYELGMVDLFREAYAEHNCYFLGPSFEGITLGGMDLMMNAPVYNLDDLRKLKVRASAQPARVFDALGVKTVYIPAQEMYTAAATGIIDAEAYGSYVLNYDMGFHEVFKYYLVPSFNAPYCSDWFVNMDVFNSLPEDLKTIVESAYY
ncbi:unnamed protein product, partial [marine sediment metagenome]